MKVNVHQGDIIMVDAEPHADHEMGGHNPKEGNIRRRFLVVSRYQYMKKSGLVVGLAITHKHIANNPFRFHVLDFSSNTNGVPYFFKCWRMILLQGMEK